MRHGRRNEATHVLDHKKKPDPPNPAFLYVTRTMPEQRVARTGIEHDAQIGGFSRQDVAKKKPPLGG